MRGSGLWCLANESSWLSHTRGWWGLWGVPDDNGTDHWGDKTHSSLSRGWPQIRGWYQDTPKIPRLPLRPVIVLTWPLPPANTKYIKLRNSNSVSEGRDSQLRHSFYSPLNSMWQSALGSSSASSKAPAYSPVAGPSASSSSVSLPGFYSGSGYPPTPPKDAQTPDTEAGARGSGDNAASDYIASSLSSEPDLMTSDMKPTPESLMGFPSSFPYSSRKIQEGN